MKSRIVAAGAAALVLAGCRKDITTHDRELAAEHLSEARFAVTLQDWPRAADLYAKASELTPDDGDTWMKLGIARMRLHDAGGARSAYKSALSALRDALKRRPDDDATLFEEATVLILLSRVDEARALVADAAARRPDDRQLKGFIDDKGIDRVLARPELKDITP